MPEKIEEASLGVYKDRLRNREIKNGLEHIREAKEKLCFAHLKV